MLMIEEDLTCVRIVEDSEVLAEMLGVILEFEDIRCCKTTSNFHMLLGPELWEGVTATLCDLDLGGPTTGRMILEYLVETRPEIKRVVLSAVSEVTTPEIVALAHIILVKPVGLGVIAEAVR